MLGICFSCLDSRHGAPQNRRMQRESKLTEGRAGDARVEKAAASTRGGVRVMGVRTLRREFCDFFLSAFFCVFFFDMG